MNQPCSELHIRASCSGAEELFPWEANFSLKNRKIEGHKNQIVGFFKKNQSQLSVYFISAFVGIYSHTLYPVKYLLGTAAQRNLVARSFLPEHWTFHQQAARNVHLCSTGKDLIDVMRKIKLHVRIGDSLMQATSHIVDELSDNIFLAASFIDKNIFGILSK